MADLSQFEITRRWPAVHPERLQLYSLATPNGIKVSVALEETGLAYEAHRIDFGKQDQLSAEFIATFPNNKIPAIIDPNGPGGAPIALFESGAILLYLAEKTGKLLPEDPAARWAAVQWLMFQMGGLGPMFGQLGYFHKFDGRLIEDKRPHERYRAESERILKVLDKALEGKEWLAGEYSVADIAIGPWLRGLDFYGAKEILGFERLANVPAYLERFNARPAVQRGVLVTASA